MRKRKQKRKQTNSQTPKYTVYFTILYRIVSVAALSHWQRFLLYLYPFIKIALLQSYQIFKFAMAMCCC